MNAEFNWWLLIVGLVIGAGLVWLILADSARRDADVAARERAGEARWIAEELRRAGSPIVIEEVAVVLELHAAYLAGPPPDETVADPVAGTTTPGPAVATSAGTTDQPASTSPEPRPAPGTTVGGSLPRRSTIGQAAGSPRSDGDGLPI